jgi:hypothetical protein
MDTGRNARKFGALGRAALDNVSVFNFDGRLLRKRELPDALVSQRTLIAACRIITCANVPHGRIT